MSCEFKIKGGFSFHLKLLGIKCERHGAISTNVHFTSSVKTHPRSLSLSLIFPSNFFNYSGTSELTEPSNSFPSFIFIFIYIWLLKYNWHHIKNFFQLEEKKSIWIIDLRKLVTITFTLNEQTNEKNSFKQSPNSFKSFFIGICFPWMFLNS